MVSYSSGSIVGITQDHINNQLQQNFANQAYAAQLQQSMTQSFATQAQQTAYAQPNQMILYGNLLSEQARRNTTFTTSTNTALEVREEIKKAVFDVNLFRYELEWAFHKLITFPLWLIDRALA